PRILILDEATASIDTETEMKIQEALKKLLKGRTAIIIAHRLSTMRESDNIYVTANGKVLENDNHDELMKKEREYTGLVKGKLQMLDAILAVDFEAEIEWVSLEHDLMIPFFDAYV